jgi:DNA-nicking Smr family endonuclease
MRRRSDRTLTHDEIELWRHVARSVHALPGRAVPTPPDTVNAVPTPPPGGAAKPAIANAKPAPPPALKPLAPLERRTLTALRRGTAPLEGVLDLHGLRQDEAHARLRAFLHRSRAEGARLVLVITGKGAAAADPGPGHAEERGVLRRVVPHWLRMADLRGVVMGFEEAGLRHGGGGALYVRLRRPTELAEDDPARAERRR